MILPNCRLQMFRAFCISLIALAGCAHSSAKKTASVSASTSDEITEHPISIALSSQGFHSEWRFTMDSKGNALVDKGNALGGMRLREFKVSERQLSRFRQALIKERFFELGGEYGDQVIDGSVGRMRIIQGQKSKMVTLLYLGNWEQVGHKKLAEAQRAARIWDLVHNWTNERLNAEQKPL